MHTQEAGAYHPRTSTVLEAGVYRPEAGTVAFPRDQHFRTTTINTNTAQGQLLNLISTAGDKQMAPENSSCCNCCVQKQLKTL
jgi:hypothetical protein